MHIHIHLPKTAGTTFNFGVIPNIYDPRRILLVGSEMPIKKLSHVKSLHLVGKDFLSGHYGDDLSSNQKLRDELESHRNFIFAFTRPGKAVVNSIIDHVLKTETVIDYEKINYRVQESFNSYIRGATLIHKQKGLLLRSDNTGYFNGSLEILRQEKNYPVVVTAKRNISAFHAVPGLKMDKIKIPDHLLIDEIHNQAEGINLMKPHLKLDCDYLAEKPLKFEIIKDVFSQDVINLSSNNKHILWVDCELISQIRIYNSYSPSIITRFIAEVRGTRGDLLAHQPYFETKIKRMPKYGIGFPLKSPIVNWVVSTNLEKKIRIGELLRYEIT